MADEPRPKIELVASKMDEKAEHNPTSVFDDLASLRKKSRLTVIRKPILVNVAVDRPANNVYLIRK